MSFCNKFAFILSSAFLFSPARGQITDAEYAACYRAFNQCSNQNLSTEQHNTCIGCHNAVIDHIDSNTWNTCAEFQEGTCPMFANCDEECGSCHEKEVQGAECELGILFNCDYDCSSHQGLSADALAACFHSYFQCSSKALTPTESNECFNCVLAVTQHATDNIENYNSCEEISDDTCSMYTDCKVCGACKDEMVESLECLYESVFTDDVFGEECQFDCPDFNSRGGSENKAGVIAGVVVAVVAVLGALTRVAVWFIRSRKRRAEGESNDDVQKPSPKTPGSPSSPMSGGPGTAPTSPASAAPSYAPTPASAPPAPPQQQQQRPMPYVPNYGTPPASPRPSGDYSPASSPRSSGNNYGSPTSSVRRSGRPRPPSSPASTGSGSGSVKKVTRRRHTDGHESIIVTEGGTTTTTHVHPNGNESIIIEER